MIGRGDTEAAPRRHPGSATSRFARRSMVWTSGAGAAEPAGFAAAVIACLAEAVVVADRAGRIVELNVAAERLYRVRLADVAGRRVADVLVDAGDGGGWPRWPEAADVAAGPVVARHRRGDGTAFDAEVTLALVCDAGGPALGLAGIVRDVTGAVSTPRRGEIHSACERTAQLERSNADLEQFAYAASHDLQEPLRSIKLGAETVLRSAGGRLDGEERALLAHVDAAAARMSAQVEALMELAQVALGDGPDAPVSVQLALDGALDALRAAIREVGAAVEVRGALPAAAVPRAELTLVLQNLLANAIKYRRPDRRPRITLSGATGDGWVEVRVADNGIGLSEADQTRIFGLFGRAHPAVPGTGMGLALCRRIVERRSGSIAVVSAGPGRGSEFVVRLPAGAGPA